MEGNKAHQRAAAAATSSSCFFFGVLQKLSLYVPERKHRYQRKHTPCLFSLDPRVYLLSHTNMFSPRRSRVLIQAGEYFEDLFIKG